MADPNVASNMKRRKAPKPPKQKGGGYRFGPNPLDTTPGFRDAQSPPRAKPSGVKAGRGQIMPRPFPGPGIPNPGRIPPGGPTKPPVRNTTGQGMTEMPGRRVGPGPGPGRRVGPPGPSGGRVGSAPYRSAGGVSGEKPSGVRRMPSKGMVPRPIKRKGAAVRRPPIKRYS
jgi:hypothetical protein